MHAHSLFAAVSVLVVSLLPGCTASRTSPIPQPGSALVRVAELPDAATDGGFGRSCAMRLRDDQSGREYLLMKSEIQTAENTVGGITIKKLASAAGDYALIRAEPSARQVAGLRVDCTTSRVVAVLAPGA